MARWALASLVDAIIFMDYITYIRFDTHKVNKSLTNLGNFLDVFDRFQSHFDFTKGGHIASIRGRRPQRRCLRRNTNKTPSNEHGDEGIKKFESGSIGWFELGAALECYRQA